MDRASIDGKHEESLLGALEALRRHLSSIAHGVPAALGHRVTLLTLELRRAREALAMIVGLLALACVLLFTGWLGLCFGLVSIAVEAGIDMRWAVGVAVVVNVAGGLLAVWRAVSLLPLLALPATVRHLSFHVAPAEAPQPAP